MNSKQFEHAALAVIAVLLLSVSAASGQSFYGTIVGDVRDATGAVVPGSKVTLTSLSTGEQRSVESDASGLFRFVNLLPGNYRAAVEAVGFKQFIREPITVEVESTVQIDVALEIGDLTEVVEVTAATPLLDSQTSSLGEVVESRKVRDLPLNGRNPLALVALVPTVIPQGASERAPAGQNFFAWGNFQIGGGTTNQSQAMWDGAPLNTNYANLLTLVPTQDSVQEFKVQTNNFSAEFGKTSGGIINITSRSGGNEFHGSAYHFLRNKVLNTNTFYSNRAGLSTPPFTQNQYGVSAGGPIMRDRVFFYANYEGFHQRRGRSFTFTVPTQQMRAGDFSNLRSGGGSVIPIFDHGTLCGTASNPACGLDGSGAPVVSRTQFPNNVIPSTRLDRAGVAMSKLWAPPNTQGRQYTNVNNFTTNASSGADSLQFSYRTDINVSDKQRMFLRYTLWKAASLEIDPYGTNAYPIGGIQGTPEDFTTQQVVFSDTYSITPTTIADVRVSWLRQRYDRFPGSLGQDLQDIGWPAFLNDQVNYSAIPAVRIPGINGFSPNAGSVILGRTENRALSGSVTKIMGAHTLKVGGELRIGPFHYFQTAGSAVGDFRFDRRFTASNPFRPQGGHGFASFMLGTGYTGSLGTGTHVSAQQIYQALYLQDDIRLTSRLTLNLGLRYDIAGPFSERYDRLSVLDPDAQSPLAGPTGLPLVGKLALVRSADRENRTRMDMNKLMFAPRFGLAYRLADRTVLRGGYGLFWLSNAVCFCFSPHLDPLSRGTNVWVATLDGSLTPFNRLSNPFPDGLFQPPGRDPEFEQTIYGSGVRAPVANNPFAYQQQWNLNLQHTLPGEVLIDAAYGGSKGTHLPLWSSLINQLPQEHMSMGSALFQQVPNPFHGLVTVGSLSAATVARGQLLRRFPHFGGLQITGAGVGDSNYHSFQLKVVKRFGSGGSLLAAYTVSKMITNGADSLTGWLERESGGVGGIQNWNNLRAERSLSSFDVPQRLVISYAYDLPVGNGKKLLGSATGAADKLVSGWGIEGITTFQAGFPIRLRSAPNRSGSFGGGSRPNSTGQSAKTTGPAQARLGEWFDTSVFTAPASFTFGNLSRTLPDVRAHGINNYDFAVFKNTELRESTTLQFRAEFFNLFNRVRFGFPGQVLGPAQFGVVSSQINDPRLIQLALRLNW